MAPYNGIDHNTQESVRWYLRYGEVEFKDANLYDLFSLWWKKRKGSPAYELQGKDHWYSIWCAMVERERRTMRLETSHRCPTCGVKLRVRNCLACDLMDGVAV